MKSNNLCELHCVSSVICQGGSVAERGVSVIIFDKEVKENATISSSWQEPFIADCINPACYKWFSYLKDKCPLQVQNS